MVPYRKLVSDIACEGWGHESDKSEDDQKKEIIKDKSALTAYALLELLNRMTAIAKAAGPREEQKTWPLSLDKAKPFPECFVGDSLYWCDFDEGMFRSVIVAKDEAHRCKVLSIEPFDMGRTAYYQIADNDYFPTEVEAVRHAAEKELFYSQPRVAHANQMIAAADSGDVSAFCDGWDGD